VKCDACFSDYSESEVFGGLAFHEWVICPRCMPRFQDKPKFIKAEAGVHERFRDFVTRFRMIESNRNNKTKEEAT